MKKVLTLVFLAFYLCSFSQSINEISWYKMLTGKIDRYTITLHLHKAGHRFFGYYYYDTQQKPIYLTGQDTTEKGRIKLIAFASPDGTEEFNFSLSDNAANGTWKKDDKSKPLSFTANETAAAVSFTHVFTDSIVNLRANLENSPQVIYEASSVWPEKNTTTNTFLKTIIKQAFFKNYNGNEEIGKLLLKDKKTYVIDYLRQNKNVKEADIKKAPSLYTMSVSKRLMIAYQSSKLLTLAFSVYSYTGGAHGNYGTNYISIDVMNKKKLGLKDMLNNQGQKALEGLLEKYFKTAHNLRTTDSLQQGGLFENRIRPNNNFYVTSKGIGFDYNPYEIGPYVMGEINIFIPAKDLEKYLKPAFKSLIQ